MKNCAKPIWSRSRRRVELRRTVNHLTALHQAGLLFSSTLDREALLEKVLETLTQDLHYRPRHDFLLRSGPPGDQGCAGCRRVSGDPDVCPIERNAGHRPGLAGRHRPLAGKAVADRRRPSRLGTDASA